MGSIWGFLFIWDWDPSKDFLFVWCWGSIWNLDQEGPKLAQCNFLHFQPLIMQSSWMIVVPLSISELPGKLSNSQPSWHEGRSNSNHWRAMQCTEELFTATYCTLPHHCRQWDASQAKGQWLPRPRGLPGNCQAVDLLPNSTLASTVLPFCTDSLIVCITSKLDIYFFPIPAFIWHDAQF